MPKSSLGYAVIIFSFWLPNSYEKKRFKKKYKKNFFI